MGIGWDIKCSPLLSRNFSISNFIFPNDIRVPFTRIPDDALLSGVSNGLSDLQELYVSILKDPNSYRQSTQ
jgi:hypothetical protein